MSDKRVAQEGRLTGLQAAGAAVDESPGQRFPKHVRLIAYAHLVSIPFEIDLTIAGRSLSFWTAMSLIIAVALQAPFLGAEARLRINGRVVLPVLAVMAYAWLSYFWSRDPEATLGGGAILLITVLTWLTLSLVIADCLGRALTAFVIGTSLMSGVVLSAEPNIDGRADIAANVNDVAVLIGLSGALLLAQITRRNLAVPMRATVLCLLTVHVAALLATGSRAGVVALALTLAAFFIRNIVRLRLGTLLGFACASGLVIAGLIALDITVAERITSIPSALDASDLNYRDVVWAAAITEMPSVLGIGFGATPAFMESALGVPTVMHSVYLGIAFELGVIGLLVWGWMTVRMFLGVRQTIWARELFMMGSVVMVMAATLTLEVRRPLWVLLAFVAAVAIVKVPATTQSTAGTGRDRRLKDIE